MKGIILLSSYSIPREFLLRSVLPRNALMPVALLMLCLNYFLSGKSVDVQCCAQDNLLLEYKPIVRNVAT